MSLTVELACGHHVPLRLVENPEGDAWAFCGVCGAGEPVEAADCPSCGASLLPAADVDADHDPHCPEGTLGGLTISLVQGDDPAEPRSVLITAGPNYEIVAGLTMEQARLVAAALRALTDMVPFKEGDPF